jgi:xylose dehydrogenase (NAD/NADP)
MRGKVKWGVISCADIGTRAVVPAIQHSRNAETIAIASRDPGRAREVATQHGIPCALEDYTAILDDPEIEAVYIPLPTSLHAEWAIRAIRHHKHVLVEKPMALDPGEVDRIASAATENGVLAMEAMMYRLHPQTKRVAEIVRSGTLGAVQLVSAAFTYHVPNPKDIRLRRSLGGGCLLDVGSYCVSIARMAMNAEPIEVVGRARIGPSSDVDEVFAGVLHFSGGRLATFGCALHGPRDQWYKITGADATLTVPVPFAPGSDDRELIVRSGWQRGKEIEERIHVPGVDQYQLMIEQFSDSILTGGLPAISLAETRANVAVLSALMQSALGAESMLKEGKS